MGLYEPPRTTRAFKFCRPKNLNPPSSLSS
jgi:hypothetical protein